MSNKEFIELVNKTEVEINKVEIIEKKYNVSLSEEMKKIISLADESIFLEDDIRFLSFSEILNANIEYDTDFVGKSYLPLFDRFENDFIVYDFLNNKWSIFNIIDNVTFVEKNKLVEILH